jgi:hypothetical protein
MRSGGSCVYQAWLRKGVRYLLIPSADTIRFVVVYEPKGAKLEPRLRLRPFWIAPLCRCEEVTIRREDGRRLRMHAGDSG